MKNLLLLLLFLFSAFAVSAQIETPVFGVEEIYLAKDNAGAAGTVVESFATGDVPIHCVVRLDSPRIVTVRMNFVAEKVAGVKPETKVISVSYKTDGKQNQVDFTGKPDGRWVAGDYRIDIYVDDVAAVSKRFEIRKTAAEAVKKPLPNIKNFAPVRLKPRAARPKSVRL